MPGQLAVTIADLVQHACPNLRLGVVVASVPSNGTLAAGLGRALESQTAIWRASESTAGDPWLAAMADTFRRAGANPGRYAPSATALVKRLRQGKDIYRINDLVDCNNLISLEIAIPVGIYDRDHLSGGRLSFDLGAPQVSYLGIDGVEQRTQGKLLLADRDKVLGGPHADAHPTRITDQTRHIVQVLYYPDALETPRAVERGLTLATERLATHCQAVVLTSFVVGGGSWGGPLQEPEPPT
ncbi:MAG: phenylalanine--tRNA ligase beta subunit-related protein [bacterium]